MDNPFLLGNINKEQVDTFNPSETEKNLKDLQEKEAALAKVVSRLPLEGELIDNMMAELQLISKQRLEAEKEFLEFKLREDPDNALGDGQNEKRRERIRVNFDFIRND